MTKPTGYFEVSHDWVDKTQLGVRVFAADEQIHAGRINRFEPESLGQFIRGVAKNCSKKGLDGVDGEIPKLDKVLGELLDAGPKGRRSRSGSASTHSDTSENGGKDQRKRIKFRGMDLHEATEETDRCMSSIEVAILFQRGSVIAQIANQKVTQDIKIKTEDDP